MLLIADEKRLQVSVAENFETCIVSFFGRKIWSLKISRGHWCAESKTFTVDWPIALAQRLSGRVILGLEFVKDNFSQKMEKEIFFGSSTTDLNLVAAVSNIPLVVNKWERLGKNFVHKNDEFISKLILETKKLVTCIKNSLEIDLFITGGTLLGAVRNKAVMPNDDDADLAYVSKYDNISDIVSESYLLEKKLNKLGYEVVRITGGHVQIMFPGRSLVDEFYIDIFAYFIIDGWFYGTFHAKELEQKINIFPLQKLEISSHFLPAPAEPATLLAAIYGENWHIPDSAFRFETPLQTWRRYVFWLGYYNEDRENWEDAHREKLVSYNFTKPSNFAKQVAKLFAKEDNVVELGFGLGADALHFASLGHKVKACEYSRVAVVFAKTEAERLYKNNDIFYFANQNMLRSSINFLQQCLQLQGRTHIYARHFFDSVDPNLWDISFRFMKKILSSGGKAFIEIPVISEESPIFFARRVPFDLERFLATAKHFNLHSEYIVKSFTHNNEDNKNIQIFLKKVA